MRRRGSLLHNVAQRCDGQRGSGSYRVLGSMLTDFRRVAFGRLSVFVRCGRERRRCRGVKKTRDERGVSPLIKTPPGLSWGRLRPSGQAAVEESKHNVKIPQSLTSFALADRHAGKTSVGAEESLGRTPPRPANDLLPRRHWGRGSRRRWPGQPRPEVLRQEDPRTPAIAGRHSCRSECSAPRRSFHRGGTFYSSQLVLSGSERTGTG